MSKVCNYSAGSIVFTENTDADCIYILQKGALSASVPRLGLIRGRKIRISEGQFFGIKEFIGKYPHESTVTATLDSVCIRLDFSEFQNLISQKPDVMKSIFKSFLSELMEIHGILESDFMGNHLPDFERVCEIIKDFYKQKNFVQCFQAATMYETAFPQLEESESLKKLIEHTKVKGMKETNFNVSAIDEFLNANSVVTDTCSKELFSNPMFKQFMQIYDNGEIIMLEKFSRDKFYYIESGEAIITKYVNGKNRYMTISRPGEFIGESSFLKDYASPITVIAKGMVKLIEFNRENFDSIFLKNTDMFIMLLSQVSKTYYRLKYFTHIISLPSVREKISALFNFFSDIQTGSKNISPTYANCMIGPNSRQIKTTEKEIASWIDASIDEVRDRLKYLDNTTIKLCNDNTIIIYDIMKA